MAALFILYPLYVISYIPKVPLINARHVFVFNFKNPNAFIVFYVCYFHFFLKLPVLAAAPDTSPHAYYTFSHACFLHSISSFPYIPHCNILYYKYILKNTYIYTYIILKPQSYRGSYNLL